MLQAGREWEALWGPQHYLPHAAETPFLWVNGTNDFAYPLDSMQKSYYTHLAAATAVGDAAGAPQSDDNSSADAVAGLPPPRLCVRVEMPHSHASGWDPLEIGAYADSVLGVSSAAEGGGAGAGAGAPPLPTVVEFECTTSEGEGEGEGEGGEGVAQLRCVVETSGAAGALVEVELCFSRALGFWPDRKYNRLPVPKEEWRRLPSIGERAGDDAGSGHTKHKHARMHSWPGHPLPDLAAATDTNDHRMPSTDRRPHRTTLHHSALVCPSLL